MIWFLFFIILLTIAVGLWFILSWIAAKHLVPVATKPPTPTQGPTP